MKRWDASKNVVLLAIFLSDFFDLHHDFFFISQKYSVKHFDLKEKLDGSCWFSIRLNLSLEKEKNIVNSFNTFVPF